MYKLDRTTGKGLNHKQTTRQAIEFWKSKSVDERLEVVMYFNSIAYNFDINNPPRMDKSVFKARKHENNDNFEPER